MFTVREILRRYSINFLSPVVNNIVSTALRGSGEKLIEKRSAYELLHGRQIKLIKTLESFLGPLRTAGFPIPEFKMGNYGLKNFSFGFVIQRDSIDTGPYEHFTRSEKGHIVNEVYKSFGQT